MRILVSNPDTIGDFVLRQPLCQALVDAGHEVMLMVRPLLGPLAMTAVPGAQVHVVKANVYDPSMKAQDRSLDEVVAAAKSFDPEVIAVGPFQWTVMEERLSLELKSARVVAMSGRLFYHPRHGEAGESKLRVTDRVDVSEDVPETRKNELMACAVLGRAVKLADPGLTMSREQRVAAEAVLGELGLESGEYWAACIGHDEWTQIRNWPEEHWATLLKAWHERYGRKFLLIGSEREGDVLAKIRGLMGDAAGAAVAEWRGEGQGDLDLLAGLIGLSRGYVGRDTGPMHVAAALKKPVLAVFGGGTWPRFLPQVDPSISLTVGVPCTGCNWVCHLPESYCVKQVPMAEVMQAMEDLEEGKVRERTTRVIKAEALLVRRIAREGGEWGRKHLTQLSGTRREHMEQTQSLTEAVERLGKEAGRAEVLSAELEALRAEMARRESLLKQRLAAAEAMFKAREDELKLRIAELEGTGGTLEQRVQQRLAEIQGQMEARARERIATEEAARVAREAETRSRLSKVQAELTEAQAQAADLKLRLQRVQGEHAALANWSRQLEEELSVVRPRLHELMSSRWRRYGQRLHLCMMLPWEKEFAQSNGKH
jgi:ADP-heptose:LPS heptosyltransferase